MSLTIAPAQAEDRDAIWAILEPMIRAGETYPLPRDWDRESGLAYWFSAHHEVFVARSEDGVLGTYYLKPNQAGGGAHIANCGYVTAPAAQGRGIARAMCAHSLQAARDRGYTGMQFNFVIATNTRAVALWEKMGFAIIGRLPGVYAHPSEGLVDALVMFQPLD